MMNSNSLKITVNTMADSQAALATSRFIHRKILTRLCLG